jgi:endonuclease/exonuclease/phosphatase (EEP) superfamily protein YafD
MDLASLTAAASAASESRRAHLAEQLRRALPSGEALLLGADLNEPPGEGVTRTWVGALVDCFVEAQGVEAASGPADRPAARIDSIWRSAAAPRPIRAFVGPAGASDHRPVVVDFEEP